MKKHGSLAIPPSGPVMFRVISKSAEGALVEMGIDYSKADVPDRAYYADYCDVVKDRFGFTLIFGKLSPGTSTLRTKIEIAFPSDMFARQLWASSREFHESVRRIAGNLEDAPIGNVQDTDKVQTFRANNVFMGTWTEEAVMDFYYISPKDMHMLSQGSSHKAMLEPVIRVAMGTGLVLEFLDKCAPFIPEAAPNLVHTEKNL